jgi:hypothetical protein
LSDSEVAPPLGAVMKIEVTELVDPEFDVVTKVPKIVSIPCGVISKTVPSSKVRQIEWCDRSFR